MGPVEAETLGNRGDHLRGQPSFLENLVKWEAPRGSLPVLAAGYNLPCLYPQAKVQDSSPLDVSCFAKKVERNQCSVSEHCRQNIVAAVIQLTHFHSTGQLDFNF